MGHSTSDPSRRAFLLGRGATARKRNPMRPPWSLGEADFAAHCSGCGACVDACPEGIVVIDANKLATIDLRRGEGLCTFCGSCADVCPDNAFLMSEARYTSAPWTWRAVIGTACLTANGIMCQSCKDACPQNAITFQHQLGGVATPTLSLARCDGCGGCVAPCPAEAISLIEMEAVHA